ncbi:MAG: hypothetical protein L0177_06240 [Chloroflexi bacterium]|nr:hypothetical protein [Chloroflexota bacterium]
MYELDSEVLRRIREQAGATLGRFGLSRVEQALLKQGKLGESPLMKRIREDYDRTRKSGLLARIREQTPSVMGRTFTELRRMANARWN